MSSERYDTEAASIRSETAQENADFALIATLGLAPKRDGNMWFFLWGEDLQTGVAGFGPTIRSAAQYFRAAIYKPLEPKP